MSTIQFEVIDTTCESIDQSFFPPKVTLTTKSTTQIATVLGYDEFIPSTPPKRYHTVTWSGTSEQKLFVNNAQIGGAKYEYSGFDHVDTHGRIDNTHSKIFSAQCNGGAGTNYSQLLGSGLQGQSILLPFKGYYGMNVQFPNLLGTPHFLCPTSSIPYETIGDVAVNGVFDQSDLWGVGFLHNTTNVGISQFLVQDALDKASVESGSSSIIVLPYCPLINVGIEIVNPPPDFFVQGTVQYNNNYSCALSDEYTDAEALANAVVFQGNGATAQNSVRTTGFTSTFTNVIYTLTMTSLVVGQSYTVSIDLWDPGTGITNLKQYIFTATDVTKSILDFIITPAPGHFTQVRNPKIAFTQ